MFEDIDILHYLLEQEDIGSDDYLFIYNDHMGGFYHTNHRQHDTYCYTCGDCDIEVDSGTVFNLMQKYMKSLLDEADYFKSIGFDIVRTLDIDKLLTSITEGYEDYCFVSKKETLEDVLNDSNKTYEIRKNILKRALIEFLC